MSIDYAFHDNALKFAESVVRTPPEFDGSLSAHNLAVAYLALLEERGLPPRDLKCYPSIQLVSGEYFDFTDPENSPMLPEDIAHALSKIARCNGHTLGDHPYSVAQHCVHASEQAPEGFKFEALMHDAAEFALGDITTPLKQLLIDFQKIEHSVELALARRYRLPSRMSPEVKTVDYRMAVTEKRDLMPNDPPGEGWILAKQYEPYAFQIEVWPAPEARRRWLEAFHHLYAEHQERGCEIR